MPNYHFFIKFTKVSKVLIEVFKTLTFPSIESTLLIKQCCLLEQPYSQKFTDEVLTNPDVVMRFLKEQVIKADRSLQLREAKNHPSQSIVAEVTNNMGWLKIWDTALDHSPIGTIAVLSIFKLLSKTVFPDRKCNVEGCDFIVPPNSACNEHFFTQHTDLEY